MRKVFLLISVLMFAAMANAVAPGTKTLYNAYNSAVAGSTLILEAGTYEETERIEFTKSMTIMAAEGAEVIVKTYKDNPLTAGAEVKFIGIKFDGSAMGTREYFIRAYDATIGNELHFENCELYNFPSSTYLINAASNSRTLDSIVIENCYFHNNGNDAIYVAYDGGIACQGVIVKNSTFANSSASHSIIEVRNAGNVADDIEVTVDHCTFYNNTFGNGDYSNIRTYKLSKSYISNCIFAHSEAYAKYTAYSYGGTISNCLSYNLTSGYRDWSPCAVFSNNITADPLFVDAANGNFALAGDYINKNISPARGAATDGSDLGDPRWYTEPIYHTTDFAAPGYIFTAANGKVDAGIEINTHYGEDAPYLRYTGSTSTSAVATWKIKATRACHVDVIVNLVDNEWNKTVDNYFQNGKHIFGVELYNSDNQRIDTVAEGLYENGSSLDGYSTYPNVNLGSIEIPAEGVYTVRLINCRSWSKCGVGGITMVYSGGAVQDMPGTTLINDAWFSGNGTRAEGKITFPGSTIQEGWVKWNVAFASTSNYAAKIKINTTSGHNYTAALYRSTTDPNPIVFANGADYDHTGSPVELLMEPQLVEAGNYILVVTNNMQNSNAELLSVQFIYNGGGTVDIPATLLPMDAIFSDEASIIDNKIDFHPSDYSSEQWAKWNIYANGGLFSFTLNAYNSSAGVGQTYNIKVYDPTQEANPQINETSSWDENAGEFEFKTTAVTLPQGNYVVKVQNTTNWSVGRVVNVVANYLGGAIVNLPGTLPLVDALLSPLGYREENTNYIHFTDADHKSQVATQWANWDVLAEEGIYTFTFDVNGPDHGIYEIFVIDDNNHTVFTAKYGKSGEGSYTTDPVYLNGNYTVQMRNTNPYSQGYVKALSAALVENTVILDEMSENMDLIIAKNGNEMRPSIIRTFRTGVYNSICLPFNVHSNSELTAIFGEGYELLEMTSATLSGEVLTLNFTTPSEYINYGTPYLIKPTKDVINPVFRSHTISKSTSHLTVQGTDANLVGVLYKQDLGTHPENLYLGADGNLYFSNSDVTIKGFRAYFHVNITNPQQVVKHARIVAHEQVVTSIDLVNEQNEGVIKTIENGQLVIIKNGVRYNVMGLTIEK